VITPFYNRKWIGSIPRYQRRGHFLDAPEIAAYKVLTVAFDKDISVFTKVALAELTAKFKPRKEHVPHWSRVQLRHIDFLVCAGPELEPILAIEIVTPSNSEKRKTRGRDVIEDVLEDVGLPLLRLRGQDEYDPAEVTRRVNLAIQEHHSATAIRRGEVSVLETSTPSVDLDSSTNSALSSTLRFLASIRDRYRPIADRTPEDTL